MKKFKLFATLLLSLFFVSAVTSCGDDDDNVQSVPAAKEIAGTYSGDLICSVMGSESVFEGKNVVVTATSDTQVSVKIDEFGEAPMALPSITVENLAVKGADGVYGVDATSFSGETESGKQYSGTLQLAYTNGTLAVNFQLNYGAMPMPLICSFTAQK